MTPKKRAGGSVRFEYLGRLAGALAHEIKNPLSTLRLNLELIEEDLSGAAGPRDLKILKRTQSMIEEVSRLQHVLDDFLSYARKRELDRRVVGIENVLDEVLLFMEAEFEAAHVTVDKRYPADASRVKIDRDYFKQAILNVILNAHEAMPDGGKLEIRVRTDAEYVTVAIADSGRGIPADDLPRIFEAYFSTKKTGTGMGLTVARRIIEEHDGTLTAESDNNGTALIFRLPAVQ